VDFRHPGRRARDHRRLALPGTFTFLGFTHFWGCSRKGPQVVRRTTARDRLARALGRVSQFCRAQRHTRVREQHHSLQRKLVGHYNYFGITGNWDGLKRFRQEVTRAWRYWLDRRSERRHLPWPRFRQLLERYPLPKVRIYHTV
ncbi:MAG: hypothetical protein AB1486_30995, partial [Planctomycetota bacterium]